MKRSTRKNMVGITLGVLIVGGSIGSLAHAHEPAGHTAAPPLAHGQMDSAHANVQMSSEEIAKHLSEMFNVSETEVKQAIDAKKDLFDVGQAAMFAKISGKSFNDVMAMRDSGKTWEQIGDALNIMEDDVQRELDKIEIMHITMRGDVDEKTANALYEEGYAPHDIDAAGIIAKASGKDVREVLERKTMKNSWKDVAKAFGVDPALVKPERPDDPPAPHPSTKE
ncbi:hypothetical protein HMPREF1148_0770 [Selenomonas sp. FOBRC6]|uniref:hypothetical protein n=1 Tax=Selenomonas sp. FOBRC6 TaxID=936572 RepID=UPI0002781ECA|nr:hypothetical protein [Selenomonas sp. FOBRC6]EJO19225.1 hypothetical protein HMPREF1148_0770 [Selenomonas sp. FOBRC6]